MPFYCYICYDCPATPDLTTAKTWQSISVTRTHPPCGKCGKLMERDWHEEHTAYDPKTVFPYTTTHITGSPIEIKSESHLRELCNRHGIRPRPDAAFIENDSGMGMPNSWF